MERLELHCETHGVVATRDLPVTQLYPKTCRHCGDPLRLEVVLDIEPIRVALI